MRRVLACMVIAGFVLYGYGLCHAAEDKQAEEEDRVIAQIDGQDVYFSQVDKLAEGLNKYLRENFMMSRQWRMDYVRNYLANIAMAKRVMRMRGAGDGKIVFTMDITQQNEQASILVKDKMSQVKLTEEDFKKYYEDNKDGYLIKERIKISYIKFDGEAKADRVFKRLKSGKPFKEAGGDDVKEHEHWIDKDMPYGPSLGGLEKLPDEVFALDKGKYSEIIKGKDNVRLLIHIDDKEPAKYRPYEEVKESIEFAATRKKKEDALQELILETFAQENVIIYEDRITKGMPKQK